MAIDAARHSPLRYRAIAALGGGGSVPKAIDFGTTRFFVGVGSRDFARNAALGLARDLTAVTTAVTLTEYPGVEHLAIVQLALPDVFTAFDAALAPR
jgi:acetyl esterase/lipase